MNRADYYKVSLYIKEFQKIYNSHNYNFSFNNEKMVNFIYKWKKSKNKFNKYSIFENAKLEGKKNF